MIKARGTERKWGGWDAFEAWEDAPSPGKRVKIMRSEMRRQDDWLDCQGRGHRDISDAERAHLDQKRPRPWLTGNIGSAYIFL